VKLSLSAAMRARDISRPHEEHVADAADQETTATPENTATLEKTATPENTATPEAPPRNRRNRNRKS